MQVALGAVVAEHAIFRTRFEFDPSEGYQQVVVEELHVNVAKHDYSTLSKSDAAVRLQGVLRVELAQPFDVTTLPLVRCQVFQKPDGLISIFVNFHHSIMDEQSLRVFVTEFSRQERSLTLGASPVVPRAARRMQYTDYYLQEERKLCNASFVDKSTHFWKQHLQGIDATAPSLTSAGAREPGAAIPLQLGTLAGNDKLLCLFCIFPNNPYSMLGLLRTGCLDCNIPQTHRLRGVVRMLPQHGASPCFD